ncbi:MAG: sensor histidine kinase [Bacteroidetes bacterium]|nr:sensor histidine kinase [Bacteroidota bacterium]
MDISGNTLIWLITAAIGIMGLLALSLVVFFLYSRRKILQEQLRQQELKLEHQKSINISSLEAQEKERRRIAKDLHDDVGSKLNVSLLYLHQLEKQIKGESAGEEILNSTREVINHIINTTRNISHDLLPPALVTHGTWASIRDLVHEINKSGNLDLTLEMEEEKLPAIPQKKGIHLYRAFQELIKNSITHGKANQIRITIKGHPTLSMEYEDNGTGFDMKKLENPGLGMSSIEGRLANLNCQISYLSAPGKGVKAMITAASATPAIS